MAPIHPSRFYQINAVNNRRCIMNPLSKSLAVFNWASQKAASDLVNTITNEKLQDCYEIQEEIGRGAYGIVKKCERKTDKTMFAIKIILFKDSKLLKEIEREIAMMRKLDHENLVTLQAAFESTGSIGMVMDYIAGGELFERIVEKEYLTEKEAVSYLRQLIKGLAYMHSKNIVHLDIKPENILCVDTFTSRIKLIDFGLARELKPGETTRCALGTPDFVAPEAISFNEIRSETDMWSTGVLTYVLLSGFMPFGGDTDQETLCNIASVDWEFDEDSFCEISSDARDFIEKLLVLRPEDRMSSTDALEHHWIHENKQRDGKINTKRHRTFLARRRWKKSVHVVMAVTKLCRILQFSSTGRSVSRGTAGNSSSPGSTVEIKKVVGEESFEKDTSSSEVEKSNDDNVFETANGPTDINGNENTTYKDDVAAHAGPDEMTIAKQTEHSKQKKHPEQAESKLFGNISFPSSNGNGEKMWKVLK